MSAMQTHGLPPFDLSLLSLTAMTDPVPLAHGPEAAQNREIPGADFASLLGLSQLAAMPPGAVAPGKELPRSGKVLPEPEEDAAVAEAVTPSVLEPPIAVLTALVAPAIPAQAPPQPPGEPQAPAPESESGAASPARLPPAPIQVAAEAVKTIAPVALPAAPAMTEPAPAQPGAQPAHPVEARKGKEAARKLDLRIEEPAPTQTQAAKIPEQASVRAVAVHAALLAGTRPGPAQPDAKGRAPKAAEPVASLAEPATPAVPRGFVELSARNPLRPVPLVEPVAPVVTVPADPAPALEPPSAPAPVRGEAPRADFATLVDRLVEAREAAAGGPVRIALRHAEFGQVAVQLTPDGAGLSVTMASADPDFVRAVGAAVPVAAAATANDPAPQGDGGRPQAQGGMSSETASQQRGSAQSERRDDGRPRANPAPQQRSPSGETRSGIFA